jgi:putative hemolysin
VWNFLNMDELTSLNLGVPPWADGAIKRALGLQRAQQLLIRIREERSPSEAPIQFCQRILAALNLSLSLPQRQLESLRGIQGPLLFVANHPFGALDALLMMILMSEVRREFRLLANALVHLLPELAPMVLPVHIMESNRHPAKNIGPMRRLLSYIKGGGLLGMFPAGEVRIGKEELPWHGHLGALVLQSKATVVPLYIVGENSLVFRLAGRVLPSLRLALLFREMLHFRQELNFTIGSPIPYEEAAVYRDPGALSAFLRQRSLALK